MNHVRSNAVAMFLCAGILSTASSVSRADESGTSFWLPGTFGSLAATPTTPGWSIASVYYHTSVTAGADVAASREIQIGRFNPNLNLSLNASLNASADLGFLVPAYTFATPVLGGQLSVSMTAVVGRTNASIAGTLTATVPPFSLVRTDSILDSVTGYGDLYPQATLKWNFGVNNFMTYVRGDIPVGVYSSTSIANLGLGHGAIDAGAGIPISIRPPGMNFLQSRDSPIISSIRSPNIRAASISTLTGARRSFCPSSSLSAWSATPTTRLRLTAAPETRSVRSSRGSSPSDRNSATSFL